MALNLPWEATSLLGVQGPSSTFPALRPPLRAHQGSGPFWSGCSPSSDTGQWTGKMAKHMVSV